MKTKKTLISVFALCTAFMLTACGGKDTVSQKTSDIQTEAGTEKPRISRQKPALKSPRMSRQKSALKSLRMSRRKPALNLQIPPAQNWTIYISRKTSFLQIMQMYGTRYLA